MQVHLLMLLSSALVAGAMVVTPIWFFRRLRRIEEQRWGKET